MKAEDDDTTEMASSKASSYRERDSDAGSADGSVCPAWLAAIGPKLPRDQGKAGQDHPSLGVSGTAFAPAQTARASPFFSVPDPATWLCTLVRLLVWAPAVDPSAASAAATPMLDSVLDKSTVWDRAGLAMDLLEGLRDAVASGMSGGLA